MNESQYQAKLMKKIQELIPECIVLKNDPRYIQGVPDILILYKNTWAMLEIKLSGDSNIQPNQKYYVDTLDNMSFASFINPQNEEDVLIDLQHSFGIVREARIS
jgi:hypothetical protein